MVALAGMMPNPGASVGIELTPVVALPSNGQVIAALAMFEYFDDRAASYRSDPGFDDDSPPFLDPSGQYLPELLACGRQRPTILRDPHCSCPTRLSTA